MSLSVITGTYEPALVVLSLAIATAAGFTALDLAGRTRAVRGPDRWLWIAAAAIAMGGGIWSMHFVAMLALRLPVEASFNGILTALSLLIAILFTMAGFALAGRDRTGRSLATLGAGVLMGTGIAAMHYTGMAAVRAPLVLFYAPALVAASVVMAICASTGALWLSAREARLWARLAAASCMGLAVSAMHYTGMAAVSFCIPAQTGVAALSDNGLGRTGLALGVAGATFAILALALMAAAFDRKLVAAAEREAAALRASRDQFQAFYKQAPVPLHTLDMNRKVVAVSDAWLELLGYDRDEVLGRSIESFQEPQSAARVSGEWDAALRHGGARNLERRFVRKSGEVLDVLMSCTIQRDGSGRIAHSVCSLFDITAQRRAEAALRSSEQRLRSTEKMTALGQLAGGIAHDFNNILQAVLGGARILQKKADDPQAVRRLAQMIYDAAQRGSSITRRLLSFFRRGELRAEAIEACGLLGGLHEILTHTLGAEVKVILDVDADLPAVLADRSQLETSLLNLATNARDAMPGGGTLTLSAKAMAVPAADAPGHLAPGRFVRIAVADTGTGMDPETVARASEPFFTTKPAGAGTGLGLAMARDFAEQSAGALRIFSEVGRGTTVELWLPAGAAGALAPDPAAHRERASFPPRRSILLVDDEDLVRNVLAEELVESGYEVIQARSGDQALACLDGGLRPDLLISDLSMPGINGLELVRAAQRRWTWLPAIILTGYANEAASLASAAAVPGLLSLLRKPISGPELADRVASLLEARVHA